MATFSSDTRPIIGRGPSLVARFVFLAAISIGLMVADHRYAYLDRVRQIMSSGVYPLQWLVDAPFRATRWASENLTDQQRLRAQNTQLTTELRDAKIDLQRLAALTEENRRLHELGDAASVVSGRRAIAQIMQVSLDPLRHRVLLNKGQSDGVFKGQPVLDAQGIFGQITQVGRYTSQALMISDPAHAIPVRVNRSGLRTIAEGTGNLNKLNLPFLTGEADIKVGDLLIASGLGGVFPPGYPVAEVSRVERNPADTFATVEAKPLARLDRDYEVVLLWYRPPLIEPATEPASSKAGQPAAASSSKEKTVNDSVSRSSASVAAQSATSAASAVGSSSSSSSAAATKPVSATP